jgi:uncharacterized membrane protein
MEPLYRRLVKLFKFGSLLSMAILGLGLIWFFLQPAGTPFLKNGSLGQFLHHLLPHDALSLLNLGILILMFLPIISLFVSLKHFAAIQDKQSKLVALSVILILALGIFLGIMQV